MRQCAFLDVERSCTMSVRHMRGLVMMMVICIDLVSHDSVYVIGDDNDEGCGKDAPCECGLSTSCQSR
jgi:hypothetical protein